MFIIKFLIASLFIISVLSSNSIPLSIAQYPNSSESRYSTNDGPYEYSGNFNFKLNPISEEITSLPEFLRYSKSIFGMSIKYPSQWVVQEGERYTENNVVGVDKFASFCPKDEAEYLSYIEQYNCDETASNLGKIGFSISVFHLPLNISLDKFANYTTGAFYLILTGFNVIRTNNTVTQSNNPAISVASTYLKDNEIIHQTQIFFIRNHIGYLLTYHAPELEIEDYIPIFGNMAKSLKVISLPQCIWTRGLNDSQPKCKLDTGMPEISSGQEGIYSNMTKQQNNSQIMPSLGEKYGSIFQFQEPVLSIKKIQIGRVFNLQMLTIVFNIFNPNEIPVKAGITYQLSVGNNQIASGGTGSQEIQPLKNYNFTSTRDLTDNQTRDLNNLLAANSTYVVNGTLDYTDMTSAIINKKFNIAYPAEFINNDKEINRSQESKIISEIIPSFNNESLGYSSLYEKATSPKMFTHEEQATIEVICQKLKKGYSEISLKDRNWYLANC